MMEPEIPKVRRAGTGENVKPWLKIQDFDAEERSGTGHQADVAMTKLCYVDIAATTDIGAMSGRYRETLAALEQNFPRVAFVHVTVPPTTEQRQLSKLKSRLIGKTRYGSAGNAARERLNALLRREYASARVAAIAWLHAIAQASPK